MKCEKCGNEFSVKLASRVGAKGCSVLSNVTTILTIQCHKCASICQLPVQSGNILSVKEEAQSTKED